MKLGSYGLAQGARITPAQNRIAPTDVSVSIARVLTVLIFAASAIYFIVVSLHWRLMVDASILHYIVFLMHHGLKPYVDISDNNLPGTYMVEAAGIRIFGEGDLGWRLYEYSLLAVLAAALIWLSRRVDWVAGVFAAGLFITLHSAEGAQYAAERELVITVLLAVAYVFLFSAIRLRRPALMSCFGLLCGVVTSIKPTYLPLAILLLVMASVVLVRRGISWIPYVLWALGGLLAIGGLDLGFLVHYEALHAFLFVLRLVTPTYAGLATISTMGLLRGVMPRPIALLLLLSIPVAISNWREAGRWDWERWALALGMASGLASYVVQRKGFLHHRYTFLVFLFLLIGLELLQGLRTRGSTRSFSYAALCFALLFFVPMTLRKTHAVVGHSDFELALQSDLNHLGGTADLQDKVQCFDLVFGCLDALQHLRLVENTGFTGDLLFFSSARGPAVDFYRGRFWELAARDPAEVIVLSNQVLTEPDNFDKVNRWPEFATYLRQNYSEVVERHFPHEHFGGRFDATVPFPEQDAYRIYIHHGSSLLGRRFATTP